MQIEQVIPAPDFAERHSTVIRATPEVVFDAVLNVTPAEVRIFRLLMTLRGGAWMFDKRAPIIDGFKKLKFVELYSDPPNEIVLGCVGRFWKPLGGTRAVDPSEVATFDEPGYAVAAMNFAVRDDNGMVNLVTETRVRTTDGHARRRFALYWAIVRPGSGAIRRSCLAAIRRRAEANSG